MSIRDTPKLQIDRQTTTPFHLKLFYRLNGFHNLSDFSIPISSSTSTTSSAPVSGPNSIQTPSSTTSSLPSHLQIYTWQTCTLRELSQLLASALPWLLPDPPVGTRLCFRLIYPDTKGAAVSKDPGVRGRFLSKDIGSVIVGSRDGYGRRGSGGERGNGYAADGPSSSSARGGLRFQGDEVDKMLHDVRFVVGDYVDCAVLPPLEDGSVAPAIGSGRGPGGGGFSAGGGMRAFRDNGYGGGGRFGRGGGGDRGYGMPSGDWRRGERLPDGGRGYGGPRRGWAPY